MVDLDSSTPLNIAADTGVNTKTDSPSPVPPPALTTDLQVDFPVQQNTSDVLTTLEVEPPKTVMDINPESFSDDEALPPPLVLLSS